MKNKGKFAFSRYDEKSLSDKKPTVAEITQSPNLFGILEANDGSIWFGAFDGVYRYDGWHSFSAIFFTGSIRDVLSPD